MSQNGDREVLIFAPADDVRFGEHDEHVAAWRCYCIGFEGDSYDMTEAETACRECGGSHEPRVAA